MYQVKEFSVLLCGGRCQPLNAFFSYAPQLSGATPLSWLCASLTPCSPGDVEEGCCAFPLHRLLGSHHGGWRHLLDRRHCVPFGEPSLTFVADSWNRRELWHFLPTHRYGRKCFTSQHLEAEMQDAVPREGAWWYHSGFSRFMMAL